MATPKEVDTINSHNPAANNPLQIQRRNDTGAILIRQLHSDVQMLNERLDDIQEEKEAKQRKKRKREASPDRRVVRVAEHNDLNDSSNGFLSSLARGLLAPFLILAVTTAINMFQARKVSPIANRPANNISPTHEPTSEVDNGSALYRAKR